jgi:hypothetical protein
VEFWEHPEIYGWTAAGANVEELFETFMTENPYLQKLQHPGFLGRKPILGVAGPNPGRVKELALAWFRRAWRRIQQVNTAAWDNRALQQYIFNAVVARVMIRHYLDKLVRGSITKEKEVGAVFWPPAYFLIHGTEIFDFANGRPQKEFFEEQHGRTRHPAVLAAVYRTDRDARWYIAVPLTSTGAGIRVDWTNKADGERRVSRAVKKKWVRLTDEMLGQYAGQTEIERIQEILSGNYWGNTPDEIDKNKEEQLEELLEGRVDPDNEDELVRHVADCDRCLVRLQELARKWLGVGRGLRAGAATRIGGGILGGRLFEAWQEAIRKHGRSGVGLEEGQLWTTRAHGIRYPGHGRDGDLSAFDLESIPRAVVILEVKERVAGLQELRVAPTCLALEMAMADRGDVVVGETESPLGVAFVVEVWNEQPMLAENLDRCLGELPKKVMETIRGMRGRFVPVSYREVVLEGLDTDPKWRFRAEEYEETAYLREPVAAAYHALAMDRAKRWLGELAEKVRCAVAPIGRLAPAPAVAAAGTAEGRRELEGEAEEGRLRWKVLREEDGSVWVWVETEEAGLEKVLVVLGGEGEGEPAVRAEVKVGPLGGGRYGGLAFIGRWEDLGLGERPVAVFAAVREGESR